MDSGGIPPPEVAISSTLKEMVKNKAIKLDPDETEASDHGKRSKRKSEKAKELSAAEKFNNFKKQRIENKGEGDIVDDLFKDFIAKKMREIDAERGHGEHGSGKGDVAKSVKDFNKYLDKEIKHISVPSSASQTKSEKLVSVKKEKVEPLTAGVQNNSESIVSVKQEKEVSDFEGPSLPPLGKSDSAETEERAPPVHVKGDSKKTMIGFKNFGIKLSLTSTELIKSGDQHKKGKRLEEGEVLSSENSNESGSSTDDENSDGEVGDVSGTGSISESDKDGKEKSKKKKKKKKGKHKKKKKHKEKGKDEENEKSVLVVKEEKSSGSKRKVSITPKSRSKSPKKKGRSRSRSKERKRKSRSKSRSRRSRSRSESKHTSKRRSRSRSKHRRSRSRSKDRRRRSRSRSRSKYRRSRSRSRSRKTRRSPTPDRFWRSKYGNFDAYQYLKKERDRERRHGKSRSRSRSPDREKDRLIAREKKRMEDLRLKIDKAKLREIAIKNAVEMAKTGVGPNVDVVLKAGGKSVEELTDFCKRISSKDMKKFTGEDFSSDEETTQKPASDDESALIHHPFKVKEAAIVMDIKNAKQLPVVTPAERLAQAGQLRLQFPVSSGSQHRQKEWVPVEKPEPMKLGVSMLPPATPSMVPPPGATSTFPPQETPAAVDDKVFEEVPQEPVDISAIISERLSAVRKLAENPHDVTAKTILTQAQKKASQWANARMLPGQFIGSTGANIMSQEELIGPDKKRQAWLKKDVFTNAAPVKSGIGMLLLQKMGWKHGEGLGKNNEGRVDPLLLDVKVDRKGLVTTGEGKKGGGGGNQPKLPPIRDLSGKHPVSALVELCNKRKWGAPSFEVIHESGPDHKKNFLFKVKVNGVEYQPSIASNNKKLAKAQAATICLQEFGLVPKTV